MPGREARVLCTKSPNNYSTVHVYVNTLQSRQPAIKRRNTQLHNSSDATLAMQCHYRPTRMHSADYALTTCLSVCPSVRLSHAGIV